MNTATTAIRNPRAGKAHRVNKLLRFGNGAPWEGSRPTGTACGYGDGTTVRAMTEHVAVDTLDPSELCTRCWPKETQKTQ